MSKSVLIVDDEIDTLKLLKMIVELSGYEAYTTLNSLEALTLAKVEQPDVVLLDIMMPNMDGFQLCKMLRADPQTRELPVIFVTAYSALDLEDRRLASGGDMILPKPVGMDTLTDAIEHVQTLERMIPSDIQQASADITVMRPLFKGKVPEVPVKTEKVEVKTEIPESDKAEETAPAMTMMRSPLKGRLGIFKKDDSNA